MAKLTVTIIQDNKEFHAKGADLDLVPSLCNHIDKSKTYSIALDQSTTCTGIYVVSTDMKYRMIMDFERLQTERKRFISYLRRLISNLVQGLKVDTMLIEKPVPHKHQRYSGDILRELKGALEQLQFDVPELEHVDIACILPQVWKAQILDKSKGKGRFNDKYAVVEDLIDMFPELLGHAERCTTKDRDSFEAVGIYHGYMKKKFDEEGNEKNFGEIEYSHVSRYYAIYVDKEFEDILTGITPGELRKNGTEMYTYDTNETFYKNIKYASTKNKEVILLVKDLDMILNLAFRFDFDYNPGKTLALFIYRKSLIKKASHQNLLDTGIVMWDEMS